MQLVQAAQEYLAIFITTALGAGVGAYLGSYLKKKGENLATHEDIDKLVAQVAAVTQTTKEIEAKISTEVWDRQNGGNSGGTYYYRRLSELDDALLAYASVLHMQPRETETWVLRAPSKYGKPSASSAFSQPELQQRSAARTKLLTITRTES